MSVDSTLLHAAGIVPESNPGGTALPQKFRPGETLGQEWLKPVF